MGALRPYLNQGLHHVSWLVLLIGSKNPKGRSVVKAQNISITEVTAVPTVRFEAAQSGPWPMVSVVVPIYNGEPHLPHLFRGLQAQTYPPDRVEFILVDNGSTDGTAYLLETYQAQEKRLRALKFNAIQSSYGARNAGIGSAQGDIVAFTDVDCQPTAQWLAALVQPFTNSAVGLVAGAIQAWPSRHWLERYAERQQTLSQHNTLNHPYGPYGQTANLAVRASLFQQVGLFRPHLTTGGDADFSWRSLQQTTWGLVYAADAEVHHRHRSGLGELRQQWYRYGCSNRYLHELHGVDLMRSLTSAEMGYRLLRWLGKELPQATRKLVAGKGTTLDLLITPLDLWCFYARTQGQRQATLPEAARELPSQLTAEGSPSENDLPPYP